MIPVIGHMAHVQIAFSNEELFRLFGRINKESASIDCTTVYPAIVKPPTLYAVICATKLYRLVKLVVGLRKYLWGNRQKDDRQKLVFHSV